MDKKRALLAMFAFLLVLPLVSANVAMPISWIMLPLLPLVVFIEGFIIWILAKKWLKVKLGFWKSVLVGLVANIATSLAGTVYSFVMYGTDIEYSLFILLAFIASVLIEWGIYILFFRLKFLKKLKIINKQLLWLSLYANLATYVLLAVFISPP